MDELTTLLLQLIMGMGDTQPQVEAPAPAMPSANTVPVSSPKMGGNVYDSLISKYSNLYGVDPNLVRAVMKTESNFNPNATGKPTKYGRAQGLMQLIPMTQKEMGVTNPYDPEQSIMGGVKYLSNLSKQAGGDKRAMVAGYNTGMGNVKARMRKYGADWERYLVPETQNYLAKIMAMLAGQR